MQRANNNISVSDTKKANLCLPLRKDNRFVFNTSYDLPFYCSVQNLFSTMSKTLMTLS